MGGTPFLELVPYLFDGFKGKPRGQPALTGLLEMTTSVMQQKGLPKD